MKPIYKPKGRAKEYGDYAINIYTGCPHRCYYCFAPLVLHRDREEFYTHVEPREEIVEATKKQITKEGIVDKLIHLCFTCDPYPTGYDSTTTREIIQILKETGNHVQILTKGNGSRDFDLLDENDWYGITYDGGFRTGGYPSAFLLPILKKAHKEGIKTWISFEPVLDAGDVLAAIENTAPYVDKIKIGKLNYYPSDIDWGKFGRDAEKLCVELGIEYYIKDDLRKEIEKMGGGEP